MKKIVYFITAFTMLYGVDSEARLPTKQGEVAVDLLLTKANIKGKTRDGYRKFIIDTIYTTDGRNNFADWMKTAYKNCRYIKTDDSKDWKDLQDRYSWNNKLHCHIKVDENGKLGENFYSDSYDKLIEKIRDKRSTKTVQTSKPATQSKTQPDPNQKAEVIKLANAFFPCWTGTFTAFFISKNSKDCLKQYINSTETNVRGKTLPLNAEAAAKVIQVSGAPSLWVLSDDDKVEQAKRYNALLEEINKSQNIVNKILWVMFVLETVDDPIVAEMIINGNDEGDDSISSIAEFEADRYSVVPVPNTFYLDSNDEPHGTCMISTILNLYNIAQKIDEVKKTPIDIPDASKIPGVTNRGSLEKFVNSITNLSNNLFIQEPSFLNFLAIMHYINKQCFSQPCIRDINYIAMLREICAFMLDDGVEEHYRNIFNTICNDEQSLISEMHKEESCVYKLFKTLGYKIESKPTKLYERENGVNKYEVKLKYNNISVTLHFGQSGPSMHDFHIEIVSID